MIKKTLALLTFMAFTLTAQSKDNYGIVSTATGADRFTLIDNAKPLQILVSADDKTGVRIAAGNLQKDFMRVSANQPQLLTSADAVAGKCIIVGTMESPYIRQIIKSGKIKAADLKGKVEKYIMTVVSNPLKGIDEALVIAGSDMRGTIYGIYELSEQIGVSPWYDWLDVPVERHTTLSIQKGTYTAGEPAVRYRGIFLNDEAPCLTTWVKNTYGTEYGDHRFYGRVFELLLRLRANFMWPAMWGWSFYADDPENSRTASDMGIIMGTSHHEPMAKNHQEWARHRQEFGEWNYVTNQKVIDDFFRDGVRRSKDNEDLITIGMRGDGDTAMGAKEGHDDEHVSDDQANINLLEKIVRNQRQIIKEETGRPAEKRQQVWALYKEVQRYYDKGLKVPEDAIVLFSDDNWGDIRIGKYVRYIPYPVLSGFMSGIGVIIILQQIYPLFGLKSPSGTLQMILNFPSAVSGGISVMALILGVISIAIIQLFPKVTKKVPATLVALIVVTIASLFMNYDSALTIGSIPAGLPMPFFTKVELAGLDWWALINAALVPGLSVPMKYAR